MYGTGEDLEEPSELEALAGAPGPLRQFEAVSFLAGPEGGMVEVVSRWEVDMYGGEGRD
jgi:hypothetical protein